MAKIVPHLWFDKEAREAAVFYTGLFEDSRLHNITTLPDTPSGDTELVSFQLAGQRFSAISAGPYFKFNSFISLMVACSSAEEVDTLWKALMDGGSELMPMGEYPFSPRYAWVQDRYGLSWQLMLTEGGDRGQKITPNLLFSGGVNGQAEEAIKIYAEIFRDAEVGFISRYGEGEVQSASAKINYAAFKLLGTAFSAMDNGFDVDFTFNEAFSLMVECRDQQEINYYWEKLSAVPEAEQCGWLKDKFGVSWQIVPDDLDEVLFKGTAEEIQRVTAAFLKMKKFDLAELERVRLGQGQGD